jgi:hypothetical protein
VVVGVQLFMVVVAVLVDTVQTLHLLLLLLALKHQVAVVL